MIAECFRRAQLVRAFCKRMTNSAGKIALKNFIEMAAIVSFGRKAWSQGSISCSSVGTGPDRMERFPVNQAPNVLYEDEHMHEPACRCLHCLLQDTVGCDEDSSDCDSRRSSICFVELPEGGVYADLIAVSGCQPNWPHFILVGEIKSSAEGHGYPFTESAQSQLVCEMMGIMLHQSVVFGILMNDKGAMLSCMKIDFERRVVDVTSEHYSFLTGIGTSFYDTALNRLFLDIVEAFNYGKENIKQVFHWPIKR